MRPSPVRTAPFSFFFPDSLSLDAFILLFWLALETARAGNRRFWLLTALRAHTKPPYKINLLCKTLRNAKAA